MCVHVPPLWLVLWHIVMCQERERSDVAAVHFCVITSQLSAIAVMTSSCVIYVAWWLIVAGVSLCIDGVTVLITRVRIMYGDWESTDDVMLLCGDLPNVCLLCHLCVQQAMSRSVTLHVNRCFVVMSQCWASTILVTCMTFLHLWSIIATLCYCCGVSFYVHRVPFLYEGYICASRTNVPPLTFCIAQRTLLLRLGISSSSAVTFDDY